MALSDVAEVRFISPHFESQVLDAGDRCIVVVHLTDEARADLESGRVARAATRRAKKQKYEARHAPAAKKEMRKADPVHPKLDSSFSNLLSQALHRHRMMLLAFPIFRERDGDGTGSGWKRNRGERAEIMIITMK